MYTKNKYDFSIIVPTYNRAHLISNTITSLLAIDYPSYEILIVDDGSTDNTKSVIESMNDPKITYVKQENLERAAARNLGILYSSGRYLNFFDSDDIAFKDHLRLANEIVHTRNEPEIFHLGYIIKSVNGKVLLRVDNLPEIVNDRLVDGNHLCINNVFIRKDVIVNFPFNEDKDLSASEDYELWIRLASRFNIYHDNRVSSCMINHGERSVLNIDPIKLISRIEKLITSVTNDEAFLMKYSNRQHIFVGYTYLYAALHLAIASHVALSLKYLIKALRTAPSIATSRRFLGVIKNLICHE